MTSCSFLPRSEFRQIGRPEVPALATASRSPPRSGGRRRHCAPRLASYRAQLGPGHGSYQRPPRRGGGASGYKLYNTILIPKGYVHDNENLIECGLRGVTSLLGLRLEIQNQLFLRNSCIIILDAKNPIRYHTFQCEF